jgi:type I restriction enzyme, S subunit
MRGELRPGYKQTEVGAIPEDWDDLPLEEITKEDSPICYGIVQVGPYTPNGVPVLAIKNLNSDYATNIHCASVGVERPYARSRIRPEDVLVSVKGTTGRVGIVPLGFHGNISRDLARLRLREEIVSRFVFQMLQSDLAQRRLATAVVGTTRMELSIAILKKVRILLPPTKAEQEAIAEALSDADALIESMEQLIAQKRQIKQGTMQELLTGKKHLPGFSGEWGVKKIADLAVVSKAGINPAANPDTIFTHFSLPAFDAGAEPIVEHGSLIGSNKLLVPPNAVLVSKLNPRIPRVWAPTYIPNNSVCSTEFLVLVPREGTDRNFLSALCLSPMVCYQMELYATGTTGSHQRIHPSQALAIQVSTPNDKAEQTAIAAILSDIDAEIAALEAKLVKARQLKQGMMQELLTGKTRLMENGKWRMENDLG